MSVEFFSELLFHDSIICLFTIRSGCTTEKILSAKAHVWVNILYFKTLSEIPSHDNGDCWVTNITDWKKKC